MGRKLTTKEFIRRAKEKHGDSYDYSISVYSGYKKGVSIICSIHGVFKQTPNHHLSGRGCPKCGGTGKLSKEEFIKKAKEIHGESYEYSLVEYKNSRKKVKLICKEHGEFEITPSKHIHQKSGCSVCYGNNRKNTQQFIRDSKQIHGDKYSYEKTKYISVRQKLTITCPKHGDFEATPQNHLHMKSGCPICQESKGEKKIRIFLEKNKINFEREYTFDDCVNINPLPFDFYLPSYGILIEYHGIQHYEPVELFGGIETYEKRCERDLIKETYAKENDIKLLIIPYTSYGEINNILGGLLL